MEVIHLSSDSEDDGRTSKPTGGAGAGGKSGRVIGDDDDSDVVIIDDGDGARKKQPAASGSDSAGAAVKNPYQKRRSNIAQSADCRDEHKTGAASGDRSADDGACSVKNPYNKKRKVASKSAPSKSKKAQLKDPPVQRELQAGLVFEEDVDHIQQTLHSGNASAAGSKRSSKSDDCSSSGEDSDTFRPSSAREYAQHQTETRVAHNLPPMLYHDPDFVAGCPSTVDGSAKKDKSMVPPKCRCRPPKPCQLEYSSKAGPHFDRPYYSCAGGGGGRGGKCNYFSWAFTSHMLHWYRFGPHNGHSLVKQRLGFRAEDLVQGKVGDCWFLSALAVVAEREDLIGRLIGSNAKDKSDSYGVVEVKLFVDGYWKTIIVDDFLPCLIDQKSEKEDEDLMQLALRQSLVDAGLDPSWHASASSSRSDKNDAKRRASSKFDRNSIADASKHTLHEIHEYLHNHRFSNDPSYRANSSSSFLKRSTQPLQRAVTTSDLAYSKARHNQLWVPFVEKAYAKIHGSYRAISGGHVEEAFLDLTGAPTAVYNFDHHDFNPRQFWSDLLRFRSKRLPMGCGTSSSQGGIVGMHAYSILDVREVKGVGIDFFRDKLAAGTLGGVSGFTDFDGTVRLLRIRNPHGQGEWKGDFSDNSPMWERLMANKSVSWKGSKGTVDLTAPQSPELKRTGVNDGVFWIDYDSFLMGFHNVDVVLAFQGNHAKSFGSSFPTKKSNHRCTRAFELSAVGRQPGEDGTGGDRVEVFIMLIQKTRRGALLGRSDRKVSYKACDTGILVGERSNNENGPMELDKVDGKFIGMNRNGHIRLMLDRSQPDRKLVIMPISFGHPSATDEERSFVVRVVGDAPLLVRELPKPPKMNEIIKQYVFGGSIMSLSNAGTSRHRGTQGSRTVLMEVKANKTFKVIRVDCLAAGGGTVLIYLVVNDRIFRQMDPTQKQSIVSFRIEVNCRGMVCRTLHGLSEHEVVSKGKKFEAAWRRFTLNYQDENKSRLLAAVVQGGQDYQMGSIKCTTTLSNNEGSAGLMAKYVKCSKPDIATKCRYANYEEFGVFASVDTPSSIAKSECIDLSSAFQNANNYASGPIEIHPDSDLNAAIMASIAEKEGGNARGSDSTGKPSTTLDEDMEKAIALSLKDT